jgi:hypothetical protein
MMAEIYDGELYEKLSIRFGSYKNVMEVTDTLDESLYASLRASLTYIAKC